MKCQLCGITEFVVLYNVDHPIENQPVIICHVCSKNLYERDEFEIDIFNKVTYKLELMKQKGKRCLKSAFNATDEWYKNAADEENF